MKKFIAAIWVLTCVGILCVVGVFYAIAKGWIGYMPPFEQLENPNLKFATQVISADGELLGTYSLSKENRILVKYGDLSPNLINALIATEDSRFYDHSGFDMRAFLRVLVKTIFMGHASAGGGSTLTQQLAKQFYSARAENIMERAMQKPVEWVIAVELERFYTKEEIMTMYLNKFDFNYNAIGIKSASNTYFSKDPSELTVEEAATLVGMCKNPSLYNPRRFNERAKDRRNVVIDQMCKAQYLSKTEADSLKQLPLVVRYRKVDHKEGIAAYFREYLRGVLKAQKPVKSRYRGWQQQKWYEDSLDWATNPLYGWCNKNFKKDGTPYDIESDGLRIYTTIDSRMQQYAEEAVHEHVADYLQPRFFREKKRSTTAPFTSELTPEEVAQIMERNMRQTDRYREMKKQGASDKEISKAFNMPVEMSVFTYGGERDTIMTPMDSIRYYKHFLRCGMMSMDPVTGYVKAYVGGPDFSHFQYDMAMAGRRQVGSTIKPYLYTLAMENGFSPCDEMRHVEQTLIDENGRAWTPRNTSAKRYGEMVSVRWGLANSDNWVTAYLMGKLSPYAFVRLLHSFGIRNQQIDPVISLCLGSCEISVGEMVSAYTAFANHGIRTSALFVTRIEDADGNMLAQFTPQVDEVISESSAYKMLTLLQAVINEGTGGRIRRNYPITADMGGKTGTTNNNSDGWFMGFTPTLVTGVWVGGEDRDIHFDSMAEGQGASMALPVWGKYMTKVFSDSSLGYSQEDKFDIPEQFNPCRDTVYNNTEVADDASGLDGW